MNTTGWIAIIISIVIAASGISYGAIQGTVKTDMAEVKIRISTNEQHVMELREQNAIMINELFHINTKLDSLIKSHSGGQ
jgi:hypothetical protein